MVNPDVSPIKGTGSNPSTIELVDAWGQPVKGIHTITYTYSTGEPPPPIDVGAAIHDLLQWEYNLNTISIHRAAGARSLTAMALILTMKQGKLGGYYGSVPQEAGSY